MQASRCHCPGFYSRAKRDVRSLVMMIPLVMLYIHYMRGSELSGAPRYVDMSHNRDWQAGQSYMVIRGSRPLCDLLVMGC